MNQPRVLPDVAVSELESLLDRDAIATLGPTDSRDVLYSLRAARSALRAGKWSGGHAVVIVLNAHEWRRAIGDLA